MATWAESNVYIPAWDKAHRSTENKIAESTFITVSDSFTKTS